MRESEDLKSLTIPHLKIAVENSTDELLCIPCTYFKWREIADAAARGGTIFPNMALNRVRKMNHPCQSGGEHYHSVLDRDPLRTVLCPINQHGHVEMGFLTSKSVYSVCKQYIRRPVPNVSSS